MPTGKQRESSSKVRTKKLCSFSPVLYIHFAGDEIYSVNGVPVQGLTHSEAITMFKEVKQGDIVIVIGRRKKVVKVTTTTTEQQ